MKIKEELRHYYAKLSPIIIDNEFSGSVAVIRDLTELYKNQETIASNESMLRAITGAAPIAIGFTKDRIIKWVNEEFEKISGYKIEEVKGKHASFLYPSKEESEKITKIKYPMLKSKGFGEIETKWKRKDGKIIDMSIKSRALDRNDLSKGVIFTGEDITKIKEAETSLRLSNEKYKSLFDNMLNGFALHKIITDEKGNPIDYVFLEANSSFEKLTGLKAKNIINKKATEVLKDLKSDEIDWVKVYGQVAIKRKGIKFEQYSKPLNKWYSIIAYSPQQYYFATVFEDITERKKSESEIKNLARFPGENPNPIFRIIDEKIIYSNLSGNAFLKELNSKEGGAVPPELLMQVKDSLNSGEKKEFEVKTKSKTYLVFVVPFPKENYVNIYSVEITDLKTIENKLRLSDNIVNHALDMLCIAGFDGYFKVLNPSWSKVLGWSMKELLSKPWIDFVYPEDREMTKNVKVKLDHGREIYQFENRYLCKNGKIKWLSWNSFPHIEEKIMYGVARDITVQKEIEEKIKKSEEKYRSLIENTNDIVYSVNNEGILNYISPNVSKYGLNDKNLIGSNFIKLIYKDDSDKVMQDLALTLKTGKVFKTIFRIKIKNNIYWFEEQGEPIKNKSGTIIGSQGFLRDITDRIKYDENLKKSEEEFRNIFESSSDGLALIDLKGTILKVNKRIIEISEYSEKEIVGKHFTQLKFISKKSIISLGSSLANYLIHPEKMGEIIEAEFITKTGKNLIVEFKGSYLKKNNKIEKILVLVRDITKEREVEKLRIETQTQKELEDLRSKFLMMLTHEIKQPITPILGYSELLEPEIKTEQGKKYLHRIIDNSYIMRDLINKILTLLKLEAGVLKLDFNNYFINKIIEEVLKMKLSGINLKNIKISKNLKDIKLKVDYNRITDVLINLIDNAIKFSHENGIIELKSWIKDEYYYLSVKDYGIGIKQENLSKIFEKFFQTEDGKKLGGSGIGLAMVKEIIKSHNGSISVKSEYKKGTEFTIKLPIKGRRE
ncbi:MAG: PAS domain S-box protein [Candidatus Nanoarchaeia archaeon]|nr:PAS domain S-box protein [Candidatus Nanoarchaeia archaeon]